MATSEVVEPARRALIYCRVSKDKRQGRSVEEQEAECRQVCEREGWTIADVLSDNGRSASRYATKTRPAWEEVKRRIANGGGVDVLVTWEASRNGRDLDEFVALRTLCRTHGVRLNYSGRTIDFDDSSDSFRAGLDALISEDESERTRGRILRAVRGQAEAGRPHGRVLFGYKRTYDPESGALKGQVPDEHEAEIVREIARRFLSGESIYAITDNLNARHVSDRPWNANRVKRILRNPGYAGLRVFQGEVKGDATWEPLIDRQTFDAIAERFNRPGARGGVDVKHLLGGIARCGKCGGGMYAAMRHGSWTYECAPGRGHLARSQRHLDAYVTVVLLDRLKGINFDDLTTEDPEVIEARSEAAKLRERLDDAVAEFNAGDLTAATLGKVEADLLPKIKAADKRVRAASVPRSLGDLAGEGVDERWDALTIEQRREVVRTLLHVTVLPTTQPRGSRAFNPDAVRLEWRV